VQYPNIERPKDNLLPLFVTKEGFEVLLVSDTGNQVFTSLSIEEWDIVLRQPVDIKKDVEIRISR
jgi:hypothetical protein